MNFGERYGFEPKKAIQINRIDSSLRNRLYNFYKQEINKRFIFGTYDNYLDYIVDKLGFVSTNYHENDELIIKYFFNKLSVIKWFAPYVVIEIFIEYKKKHLEYVLSNYKQQYAKDNIKHDYLIFLNNFTYKLNEILEEENSGYRFCNDVFVPITNSIELESIKSAINSIEIPGKHIEKALILYSDKEKPDYENSIKESISAVESMCCIICGQDNKGITLGKALNNLEKNGVEIHPALIDAFKKMYGYTSDAGGIRHGSIDFTNAPAEDAKYMLVTCSAFINYLKEKKY